jgi:G3E family GTPase
VDDDLKDACQLDAVLTVLDSKHLLQHLDERKPDGVVNEAGEAGGTAWRGGRGLAVVGSAAEASVHASIVDTTILLLLPLSLLLLERPTVQQVAFADKLLLNKIDLVDDAVKAQVIKRVRVRAA